MRSCGARSTSGIGRAGPAGRGHLLVTAHRRESWGDEIEETFRAIGQVALQHPDLQVLFPVHLNPVVQAPARALLGRPAQRHAGGVRSTTWRCSRPWPMRGWW